MNIVKNIGLFIAFTVIIVSCQKRDYNDSGVMKPTNISASGNFNCGTLATQFGGAPTKSIDFSSGVPLEFAATFNETVTWKIVLRGQSSTAIKTITGTSSVLNASNATWSGNHDELYFFEKGEKVSADLIISGKDGICTTDTVTILQTKDSKTSTATFMLVNPNSDFEAAGAYPAQFSIFRSPYAPLFISQDDTIQAPEGVKYLRLYGKSSEANGFFVGGVQCRKDAKAEGYFFPKQWTDPEKIYLNVYVRGIDNLPAGCKPYATLNFECHEDDRGDMSDEDNCDYYASKKPTGTLADHFCPSSEDSWVFKLPVQHIGWKLFSCKYSDLLPSEDFANGGFGNRKLEPQKVCRVQFGMVSSPPFNLVSIDLDYACFTYGAPYDPKK